MSGAEKYPLYQKNVYHYTYFSRDAKNNQFLLMTISFPNLLHLTGPGVNKAKAFEEQERAALTSQQRRQDKESINTTQDSLRSPQGESTETDPLIPRRDQHGYYYA